LDKNTLGGESSKSGCNVLEFYYSSTYDTIHCHRFTYHVSIFILTHEYKNLDPYEESCYSSKINSQWKGVQIYIDDEAKNSFMSSATSDE
jgi:hypothetical protein